MAGIQAMLPKDRPRGAAAALWRAGGRVNNAGTWICTRARSSAAVGTSGAACKSIADQYALGGDRRPASGSALHARRAGDVAADAAAAARAELGIRSAAISAPPSFLSSRRWRTVASRPRPGALPGPLAHRESAQHCQPACSRRNLHLLRAGSWTTSMPSASPGDSCSHGMNLRSAGGRHAFRMATSAQRALLLDEPLAGGHGRRGARTHAGAAVAWRLKSGAVRCQRCWWSFDTGMPFSASPIASLRHASSSGVVQPRARPIQIRATTRSCAPSPIWEKKENVALKQGTPPGSGSVAASAPRGRGTAPSLRSSALACRSPAFRRAPAFRGSNHATAFGSAGSAASRRQPYPATRHLAGSAHSARPAGAAGAATAWSRTDS